jgi:hypothetical protein
MKREIVNALIESLNDPNAGWVYDRHTATNDRIKCEIWLASGIEFLGVRFWGDKIGPSIHGWDRQIKFGGANFFGFLIPWRWRVYLVANEKQEDALKQAKVAASTIVAAIRSASEVAV